MNLEVDFERLLLAEKTVRAELLAERAASGHWPGAVASSPVATAAAVSALVLAHRQDSDDLLQAATAHGHQEIFQLVQGDLSELLVESVHWLARRQNPDGGWGDCEGAASNLAATLLVQSAFRLTGIPGKYADLMVRSDQYVSAQGGVAALRKKMIGEKTYQSAVLANAALAGLASWRLVPTIPFEWLWLPSGWRRELAALAAPPLSPPAIAIGLAKFHEDPTKNPVTRLLRRSLAKASLSFLRRRQAGDDSFDASPLITAVVVMNVAGMGCQQHPVVERGVEFLLTSVRSDASWAVTTNFSTIYTSMALESLARGQHGDRPLRQWHPSDATTTDSGLEVRPATAEFSIAESSCEQESIRWLLKTQRTLSAGPDPARGGWAASDALGGQPETVATGLALVALARARDLAHEEQTRLEQSATEGARWLLETQNTDGGWTTFGQEGKAYPHATSEVDPTVQAIRGLAAWRRRFTPAPHREEIERAALLQNRINDALARAMRFLESRQREDGSFVPRWFGNEHQRGNENPVLGTSLVLLACDALERLGSKMAMQAATWLIAAQHSGGGWGPPRVPVDYSDSERDGATWSWRENDTLARYCSLEETSAAVAALLPLADTDAAVERAITRGLNWLTGAVEQDAHRRPAIVGFYRGKIWYYDRLTPLAWAAGTLSQALGAAASRRSATTTVG